MIGLIEEWMRCARGGLVTDYIESPETGNKSKGTCQSMNPRLVCSALEKFYEL